MKNYNQFNTRITWILLLLSFVFISSYGQESAEKGNLVFFISDYIAPKDYEEYEKLTKEFKKLASSLIDKKQPATYNQAIMEFGARQCKPKSPDCDVCPVNDGCMALQKKLVDTLPVKLKKTKVTTKYFNYLICIDKDKNILFEKRTHKGIWQNLYQFPLIESEKSLGADEFHLLDLKHNFSEHTEFDYSLYNEVDKVHKLSHQHLYTKFWIIEIEQSLDNSVSINELKSYPAPVLISDFINEFNFETI